MFCPNCGNQLEDGANFCPACGSQLGGTGANAPFQPQQPMLQEKQPYNNQQAFYPPPTFPQQGKAARRMNIFGIIASIVYTLAAFLPMATVTAFGFSKSAALIDGSDWMFVIPIGIIGIVASVIGVNGILLVMSAFASLIAYIEYDNLTNGEYAEFYTKGAGFYFLIFGALAMIITAIIGIVNKKKIR